MCVAGIGRMIKQISVCFAYFSLLDSCYHGHIVKKVSLMREGVRPSYLVQLESSDDRDRSSDVSSAFVMHSVTSVPLSLSPPTSDGPLHFPPSATTSKSAVVSGNMTGALEGGKVCLFGDCL